VVRREPLFADRFADGGPHQNYDVSPDGRWFAMIAPDSLASVVVVVDWATEVRERMKRVVVH
jgi:hypothetical protein